MVMAKPSQPSRKMFIKDLSSYELSFEPSSNSNNKVWLPTSTNASTSSRPRMPLKFVWLQGDIVQFDCPDTFILDDGTGLALIGGCCKLPPVCPKPRRGGYFMVIGELKALNNIPAVKAYKLQDLSGEEDLKTMWPLEIYDMRNFQQ